MVTPYLPSSHNHRRRLPILLKIGMISSVNTMYCHLLHTATSMKIRYLFATQNVYIRYGPCIRNIFVFMHIYLQTHHYFLLFPLLFNLHRTNLSLFLTVYPMVTYYLQPSAADLEDLQILPITYTLDPINRKVNIFFFHIPR